MVDHISTAAAAVLDKRVYFDSKTNVVVDLAFDALRDLTNWFESWHKNADVIPNLRVSRTLVAVCVGEHVLWNSNENSLAQLHLPWLLGEWEKGLREDLGPLSLWRGSRMSNPEA